MPVTAAVAVTGIAVLVAVVLPRALPGQKQHPHGLSATSLAVPKFLIANPASISPLDVRNAATGTLVVHIKLPAEPGSQAATSNPAQDGHTYVGAVATGSGRTFVVRFTGSVTAGPGCISSS